MPPQGGFVWRIRPSEPLLIRAATVEC